MFLFHRLQASRSSSVSGFISRQSLEEFLTLPERKQRNLEVLKGQRQQAEFAFYAKVTPIFEQKQAIERQVEFIEKQIAYNAYQRTLDEPRPGQLTYADFINEAVANLAIDYQNYLGARDFVWRDNTLVDISSKAAKAQELNNYRELLQQERLNYGTFVFTEDANLRARIDSATERYNALMEEQTTLTQAYFDQVEKLDAQMLRLEKELVFLQRAQFDPHELEIACITGNVGALKLYVQSKAPKKAQEVLRQDMPYALHLACRFGQLEVIDYLLSVSVKVNEPDIDGYSPLHHAVESHLVQAEMQQVLDKLVAAKADVKKLGPKGNTVLHAACLMGNEGAAVYLVERYPQLINQADTEKNTPLHQAALAGFSEVCGILLTHDANSQARNGTNLTPLLGALLNDKLAREQKVNVLKWFADAGFCLSAEDRAMLKSQPDYEHKHLPIIQQALNRLEQAMQASVPIQLAIDNLANNAKDESRIEHSPGLNL